jgi:transcriptional regulator with XRE-family HTH domain
MTVGFSFLKPDWQIMNSITTNVNYLHMDVSVPNSQQLGSKSQLPKRVCPVDIKAGLRDTAYVSPTRSEQLFYRQFGRILADARNKKKLSQEVLARELGLSRTSVTNIEKGRQPVQLHTLYHISQLLSVDLKDLLPAPQLIQRPEADQDVNVSRTDWLETMNVKLPDGGTDAKTKRYRTRSKKTSQR